MDSLRDLLNDGFRNSLRDVISGGLENSLMDVFSGALEKSFKDILVSSNLTALCTGHILTDLQTWTDLWRTGNEIHATGFRIS
jgi:AAA15 family ATPase/GTPase